MSLHALWTWNLSLAGISDLAGTSDLAGISFLTLRRPGMYTRSRQYAMVQPRFLECRAFPAATAKSQSQKIGASPVHSSDCAAPVFLVHIEG